MSIMIRCMHNELTEQHMKQPGGDYYRSLQQKYGDYNNYDDSNARLNTVEDEDDFDMNEDMMDDDPEDKLQVDIDIQKDDDEEFDIEKRFLVSKADLPHTHTR